MAFPDILEILKESLILTAIVVGMMCIIELADISSKGKLIQAMKRSRFGSIAIAALLGAIPGCVGGYITVSMYSKRVIGFGALLAMMIATTGDEAFLMLAMYPGKAAAIFSGLFILGIIAGLAADRLCKKQGPDAPLQDTCAGEEHSHTGWKHLLLHALKVFLWAFSVMVVVALVEQRVDIESWISNNTALMILLATLIGCIPQSGPHMIFVTLFAGGVIPLPVLLASCISQDGHAGLPLIADRKKAFFQVKVIKCILALAVGFGAMLIQ